MTHFPPDDRPFHSVDAEQLQRLTVADIETGNLFPDITLDDSVPVSPHQTEIKPGMTRQSLFMWEATTLLAMQGNGGLGMVVGFGD